MISSKFGRLVANSLNKMKYRWNTNFIESKKAIGQRLGPKFAKVIKYRARRSDIKIFGRLVANSSKK